MGWIIFAFIAGGIVGMFVMGLFAMRSDHSAFTRGYVKGREDEKAHILEQIDNTYHS